MERIISNLKKLVSINSIYPNEYEVSQFLFDYLKEKNFKVEKLFLTPNRFNVIAEKGSGNNSFLLYAHTDTVPLYGKWDFIGFNLTIKNKKAIGLGSADMKGGISAILESIDGFLPKNFKLKVCFAVDEENFSEGAFHLEKTSWLDDVKGILVPESCLPASKSKKAERFISIGRKGRTVLTIKIKGLSAHGVEKSKGINAIEEGSTLINFLKNDFPLTDNKNMGKSDFFVRRFEGKSTSLSIPDYAEIELDFHLVSPDTSEKIKKQVVDFISNLKMKSALKADYEVIFSPRPTPFLEPFEFDKDEPFLKTVIDAMYEVYGEVFFNYGQSVADENVFGIKGIPTFTVGPLGDNHHSANEWVDLDSLKNLAKVYRKVLEKLDLDSGYVDVGLKPTSTIPTVIYAPQKHNKNLYQNKLTRLKGYDYSKAGAYYVTICTHKSENLFGEIKNGEMILNEYGQIVYDCWFDLLSHYHNIELDFFVIMPNHFHCIVMIVGVDCVGVGFVGVGFKPTPTEMVKNKKNHALPEIIRALKTFSARKINELRATKGSKVWQRNYYEHIIRNEKSLEKIREYIVNNTNNWNGLL